MKKIAIFVEGQTEQFFVNKLLKEIAGEKRISISLLQLRGGSKAPKKEVVVPQPITNPPAPVYEALIYDCGSDNKVKSDILDNAQSLSSNGYSKILGIRDLFPIPLPSLTKLEDGLNYLPPAISILPIPFKIIVAVYEIEAWFISECTHFERIDSILSPSFIQATFGFNPCNDDITLRSNPAQDLNLIYQVVGKAYNKKKNQIERTVACLDYANMYFNISNKIKKLNDLIQEIDSFLI